MTKVYRNFTRDELDREYNIAAYVGNTKQYFADYNSRSEAVRQEVGGSFDIPYGASTQETLDLFFPQRRGAPCPIHIFFHGGGYRSQDKSNFSYVAAPLVAAGAIVVVPNYGLCPAYRLDQIIHHVRSSIAWTHAQARVMGGDPHAITISGHSAGAHAVARALETDWSQYGRTPDDVVKSAIAVSGMYDQEPRRLSFLNEFLRLDEEESLRNSCIHNTPRRRVPFLVAVGELECQEYIRQSADYVAALQGRSYDAEYMLVPGRNHYDVLDPFVDFSQPLGARLRSLAMVSP